MRYLNLNAYGRQKDPFFFALESVLLENIQEDIFFIWHVYPAVIIGKHQLLENEVNQSFLKSKGIPVYRRLSGGGAVYSDEGCIKYSFLSKNFDKETIFKNSLNHIKSVFDKLNINVELSGRNDILSDGKKFSGNAYFHNVNGSCLHGTILYDTDFEVLVKTITPDNEKLISKGIESVRSRVTNMKDVVGLDQEVFTELIPKYLCDSEFVLTKDLETKVFERMHQYEDPTYIYGSNPPYTYHSKKRLDAGTVGIHVDIHKGIIQKLTIYGDYFIDKDPIEIENLLGHKPFNLKSIKPILDQINMGDYILNLTNEAFLSLFEEGPSWT